MRLGRSLALPIVTGSELQDEGCRPRFRSPRTIWVARLGSDDIANVFRRYATRHVRALPLAGTADSKAVPPDAKHAFSGEYPLAKPLQLTVAHSPDRKLKPLMLEFLRFVYSRQGHETVVRDGYFPLDFDMAAAEAEEIRHQTATHR